MAAVLAGSSLVCICDSAGRPRGTGFPVDFDGTLLTSHEAVDGLDGAMLRAPGVGSVFVEDGQITALPEWNLALLRTTGLRLDPFVLATGRARLPGTRVQLCAERPLAARIAGTASLTYAATDCFHSLDDVLTLALPRSVASGLRLSRQASGSPVLDAATGAVLAVLGTAMHAPGGGRAAAFAVQPRAFGGLEPAGPLDRLLRHNDATVPGFGPDLNLAGALRLTGPRSGPPVRTVDHPVLRPEIAEELRAFGDGAASVVALVGDPGSGRTTELAAWAARRSRSVAPAPNVWLRGADLWIGDPSVREAVDRALCAAGRVIAEPDGGPRGAGATGTAAGGWGSRPPSVMGEAGGTGRPSDLYGGAASPANPDVVARLARDAGRPLLVLLDAPEEMPPALRAGLGNWTAGSSSWLRASGARLAVACRPEFWEQWGALFPPDTLHVPGRAGDHGARSEFGRLPPEQPAARVQRASSRVGTPYPGPPRRSGAVLAPCVRVGDLSPGQAARLRARGALPPNAIASSDARHPLTLRMATEIAAARNPSGPASADGVSDGRHSAEGGAAHRPLVADEIFAAHLDLQCLRVALRLTAGEAVAPSLESAFPQEPITPPSAVRRLAARVSGQLHAAARRSLASANGGLSRTAFAELFPEHGGWASAVIAEGVLTPTGETYHFVDEEFGDWLQGCHVELSGALDTAVHHAAPQGAMVDRVPRCRIGPVLQALLRCGRLEGPEVLGHRLRALLPALCAEPPVGASDASWWAAHLLGETLLRVPDAGPYVSVLDALAARIRSEGGSAVFGPWFWRRLPLPTTIRIRLLRQLLPTDPAYAGPGGGDRHLDTVAGLLEREPEVVAPLLCTWFDDERLLAARCAADSPPTVAGAAQALLYACPACRSTKLLRTLAACPHPRARELLTELGTASDSALTEAAPTPSEASAEVVPVAALPAPRAATSTARGRVAEPSPVPDPVESPGRAP